MKKNKLQKEKIDMRTCARSSAPCAHVCTLKTIYARTHTQISENFPAPICTKITALKVCKNHSMSSQRTFFVNEYFWLHYSNKHKIMDWKTYFHFRVAFGVIWLNLLKYFLPIQQRKCPTTSLVFSCRVSFSSFWYPSFKLFFKFFIFSVRYFFSFIGCSLSYWFNLPLIEPKNDNICSLYFHEWYNLST